MQKSALGFFPEGLKSGFSCRRRRQIGSFFKGACRNLRRARCITDLNRFRHVATALDERSEPGVGSWKTHTVGISGHRAAGTDPYPTPATSHFLKYSGRQPRHCGCLRSPEFCNLLLGI